MKYDELSLAAFFLEGSNALLNLVVVLLTGRLHWAWC